MNHLLASAVIILEGNVVPGYYPASGPSIRSGTAGTDGVDLA